MAWPGGKLDRFQAEEQVDGRVVADPAGPFDWGAIFLHLEYFLPAPFGCRI